MHPGLQALRGGSQQEPREFLRNRASSSSYGLHQPYATLAYKLAMAKSYLTAAVEGSVRV